MEYEEFRRRVGTVTLPQNVPSDFFGGENSMHFLVVVGEIKGDEYEICISSDSMERFVGIIDLLELRGALREKDYIVCCGIDNKRISLGIHTNTKFLSDEDFDESVWRIRT